MTQKITTDPVAEAFSQGTTSIHALLASLELHIAVLPDGTRQHLPVVPETFPLKAGTMLEALSAKPEIAAACAGFDAAEVEAQLRYVTLLTAMANEVDQLKALIDDGLRTNLTGAFKALLPVYNTAKSASRYDTTLKPIVAPMEEMYASRKKAKSKGE